jgi:hypothetical protein
LIWWLNHGSQNQIKPNARNNTPQTRKTKVSGLFNQFHTVTSQLRESVGNEDELVGEWEIIAA